MSRDFIGSGVSREFLKSQNRDRITRAALGGPQYPAIRLIYQLTGMTDWATSFLYVLGYSPFSFPSPGVSDPFIGNRYRHLTINIVETPLVGDPKSATWSVEFGDGFGPPIVVNTHNDGVTSGVVLPFGIPTGLTVIQSESHQTRLVTNWNGFKTTIDISDPEPFSSWRQRALEALDTLNNYPAYVPAVLGQFGAVIRVASPIAIYSMTEQGATRLDSVLNMSGTNVLGEPRTTDANFAQAYQQVSWGGGYDFNLPSPAPYTFEVNGVNLFVPVVRVTFQKVLIKTTLAHQWTVFDNAAQAEETVSCIRDVAIPDQELLVKDVDWSTLETQLQFITTISSNGGGTGQLTTRAYPPHQAFGQPNQLPPCVPEVQNYIPPNETGPP